MDIAENRTLKLAIRVHAQRFIIPMLVYFTVLGHFNAENMAACSLLNPGLTSFSFFCRGRKKMGWNNKHLIRRVLDNKRRHFTRCSHFSRPVGSGKYYVTSKTSIRITYQNTD